MKPGIYPGISFEDYMAIDAISRTEVNTLIEDGVYAYRRLKESGAAREETSTMRIGTAAHAALFEPEKFGRVYRRINTDRRGSVEWNQKVAKLAEGIIPLKAAEYDAVLGMRSRALASKTVAPVLAGGASPELTVVAEDPDTGLMRKCRLDGKWFQAAGGVMVPDLKTGSYAVTHRAMRKKIANDNLHRQAAWYVDTVQLALAENPDTGLDGDWWFCIVAIRQTPPHSCGLHRVSQEAMRTGRAECQRALRFIAAAEKYSEWPSEDEVVYTHDLPGYKEEWKPHTYPGPVRVPGEIEDNEEPF